MKITHIYPVLFVIVLLILGGVAYAKWNGESDSYETPSGAMQAPGTDAASTTASSTAATSYTAAQVAEHASSASCWTSINGGVYDLTKWIGQHPGGEEAIESICGKDGSDAFNGQHGGQKQPESALAMFKIGTLAQ